MQFKKILSAFEYTNWLFKKYNEQHTKVNNIYRIVEIQQSPSGKYKVFIQIIGKATLVECSPQEIVADDLMLEGFSKKDIRIITYLACQQTKKPKYKIVMQEFCNKFNRMLFKLKSPNTDEAIVKTAAQISLDKNLINNLSNEDIQSISYIAGYEHSLNEKKKWS